MKDIVYNLSDEERIRFKEYLIDKYTSSKSQNPRKTKWKDEEFVENVIKQHIKYLTVTRNDGITQKESLITEKDAFRYMDLYDTRKRPNFQTLQEILNLLDNVETIGRESANKILKNFGKIVENGKEKLLLQIKIINKFNYMDRMIENPSKFILSPEYLYARLAYYQDMNGDIRNIPASEVLGDKDKYTEGNKKQITGIRKLELLREYSLSDFDDNDNKGER